MADLVVPQLGESITEAVIARWLKQAGDAVAVDEPVAELETDKITVQLPSPVAGAMGEQRAQVGATVKVGDVIGTVEAGKAAKTSPTPTPPPPPKPAPPPAPAVAAAPVTARSTGNGESIDRESLMRLTPSQRHSAREKGAMPSRQAQAAAAPAGPSVDDRLAQVDPR